jgi:hypothetical protein
MTMVRSSPFLEGQRAFTKGKSFMDNPYVEVKDKRTWRIGYEAALIAKLVDSTRRTTKQVEISQK